jgi:hypothetical protein
MGNPDVMYLDMWPIENRLLLVYSHHVAEQVSRSSKSYRYSVDKSPTMHEFDPLIGESSMILTNVSLVFCPLLRASLALAMMLTPSSRLDSTGRGMEINEEAIQSRICSSAPSYSAAGNCGQDEDISAQHG